MYDYRVLASLRKLETTCAEDSFGIRPSPYHNETGEIIISVVLICLPVTLQLHRKTTRYRRTLQLIIDCPVLTVNSFADGQPVVSQT